MQKQIIDCWVAQRGCRSDLRKLQNKKHREYKYAENLRNKKMPKNTEYKKYKMQKETIEVEWHKEAADQSSENCKLQKKYRKTRKEMKNKYKLQNANSWPLSGTKRLQIRAHKLQKTKNTTNTKCKMQTLDRWVAQRGCRPEAGSRASLLPCRGAQFGLATLWERFSELFS